MSVTSALKRVLGQFLDLVRAPAWKEPLANNRGTDVVILDAVGAEQVAGILGGWSFHILPLRGEYVHRDIMVLVRFFVNIAFVGGPLKAYALAVIQVIRPKLVVTLIDNSGVYQSLVRHYREGKFLAIQNGTRNLVRDNPSGVPAITHQHFACFGESVVAQYREHGAEVLEYHPIGSLRQALSCDSPHQDSQKQTNIFDVCLVSEVDETLALYYPEIDVAVRNVSMMFARFCSERNLKHCIISRYDRDINPKEFSFELDYFRSIFGASEANLISNKRVQFGSYSLLGRCRVAVAFSSTLLLERFGEGGRVLFSDTGQNYRPAMIGPWYLEDASYEEFASRLLWLLEMSESQYASKAALAAAYMMHRPSEVPRLGVWKNLISTLIAGPEND